MTVEKFLKAIGRGCAEYTDKFESWEQLMGADRWALKNAGIPIRQRKWIRNWVEKYKRVSVIFKHGAMTRVHYNVTEI
jgi:hypothetical protein